MPGQLDIMRAIASGLDRIDQRQLPAQDGPWTRAVLTELCQIGRKDFSYKVGARAVPARGRDWGQWIYDLTWVRYDGHGHLIDVPLVAQCNWNDCMHSFDKLLLARAGVRLMIYSYYAFGGQDCREQAAQDVAERLAESVRRFGYRHKDEAWLLAGGVWLPGERTWCRYFTIDRNGRVVPFLLS